MLKFPDIDPVIISFGKLAVSWYSLSYVTGILLGWWYILQLLKRDKYLQVTPQQIDDFISWIIIGVILGGRLGYVLFYDPIKYFSNPIQILKIYEGGMSFHGGILGVIITIYLFCRAHKISFWNVSDLCAAATPIALALGRVANFINAELYGRVTDVPWAFSFPYTDGAPRHPSQLYEAMLEGVILFVILRYCTHNLGSLKKPAMTSGIFLIGYSTARIFVEFFREADVHIGYLMGYFTWGQILSVPMLLSGIFLLIYRRN